MGPSRYLRRCISFVFLIGLAPGGILASKKELSSAYASTPCVRFDVDAAVACPDVTPQDWSLQFPGEKLIRIRFQISSLITLGREDALLQYLYVVKSASRPFQVVEFSPRTELASDIDGKLVVDKQSQRDVKANFKAALPPTLLSSGDFSASYNDQEQQTLRYEQLPAKHLVAASGTVDRGAGVYFKLKPSTQTTLEGDKTFELVARVPSTWRGGLLYVRCTAYGEPRGFSSSNAEEDLVCGANGFWVGLYLAGDFDAQQQVTSFYNSRERLQRSAHELAHQIESQRFPSWGHKLGAAISIVSPRIPENWLDQVLISPTLPSFSEQLPDEVVSLAKTYQSARSELASLSR